jgi:aminoglycoside phosphotransferase (APT) family kinase protein
LTAILIADDRPVAVIDGSVVKVGDTLPDGARITAIRSDRVAVMERNGQHRVLTISPGGP